MKKKARIFGAVLCICAMLLCGYMLYSGEVETTRGNSAYETIQDTVKIPQPATAETVETAPDVLLPVVNFGALRETNPDIVAWIYSPGTAINYPVVQGKDNQYYLKRLFDGSYNNNGCIFLDFRNSPDFSDGNSVLYGHHMKTEAMFSSIEGYKKQDYYEAHPVLYLITETTAYKAELYAGVVRSASDIPLNFGSGEELLEYTGSLKKLSTFNSDAMIAESDRLLTLSTCVYDFQDARYMLVGKLVRIAGK